MPARITAEFPGAKCPAGSRVRFPHRGAWVEGTVTQLKARTAVVAAADGKRWAVPYGVAQVLARAPSQCSLADVEALAARLLARSVAAGELAAGWTFEFDLAPSRGGVCHHRQQRIGLSVSFCLCATEAEIEDTLLHEIAHAIVGERHGHDAVWQAKAKALGCSAATRHAVCHSIARWIGECGCGGQWLRWTLQRKVATGRVCAKCREPVVWRRNVELATRESV